MKKSHGIILTEPVPVELIYPLRLLVLRPGGTLPDCVFEGDKAESTLHLGAYDAMHNLKGIASYYEAPMPGHTFKNPVQLRGMATHPEARGMGFGKELIHHGIMVFSAMGKDVIWCNAREVAVGFYTEMGFKKAGDPFDIPGIGAHYQMVLSLTPPAAVGQGSF